MIKNPVKAIDVYAPGLVARYRVHGEGYVIDRRGYGVWLLDDAINRGAEVMLRALAVSAVVRDGRVRGVVVRAGGVSGVVEASVVVEATGMSQRLIRGLPPQVYRYEPVDPRDTNIAYREVAATEVEVEEPEVLRIYLDKDVAPGGYWWLFPEGRFEVNVGLGVQGGRGHPHPRLLYEGKLRPRIARAYGLRRISAAGAPVPTRRPADTLVGEGIVVVGDAGYTVNPLHGGGMGYSFYAARLAAEAIEEAYDRGDFSARGLWRLNVEYMRSLGGKQAALDVFRRFLQELTNDDIAFAMERKLIPEADVYDVSSTGRLKLSVVEKIVLAARGLGRPTLLLKLKTVSDYMDKVRELYKAYPEGPEGLARWADSVRRLFDEFERKIARGA